MLRLALLEYSSGGSAEGQLLEERLVGPEISSALPLGWADWVGHLESLAPRSARGGGPFPPPPPEAGGPGQTGDKKPGKAP